LQGESRNQQKILAGLLVMMPPVTTCAGGSFSCSHFYILFTASRLASASMT
jgi:hypothetical protein